MHTLTHPQARQDPLAAEDCPVARAIGAQHGLIRQLHDLLIAVGDRPSKQATLERVLGLSAEAMGRAPQALAHYERAAQCLARQWRGHDDHSTAPGARSALPA